MQAKKAEVGNNVYVETTRLVDDEYKIKELILNHNSLLILFPNNSYCENNRNSFGLTYDLQMTKLCHPFFPAGLCIAANLLVYHQADWADLDNDPNNHVGKSQPYI